MIVIMYSNNSYNNEICKAWRLLIATKRISAWFPLLILQTSNMIHVCMSSVWRAARIIFDFQILRRTAVGIFWNIYGKKLLPCELDAGSKGDPLNVFLSRFVPPPSPPPPVTLQPNLGLGLFNPPPPCLSILCRSPVPASQHPLSVPVPAFRSRSEHCSNIPCSKS